MSPGLKLLGIGLVVASLSPLLAAVGASELVWLRAPQGLALLASLALVHALAPEDPPRRPWLLLSVANALLLTGAIADTFQPPEHALRIRHGLLIGANILGAAALLFFVVIVRRTGLVPRPGWVRRVGLTALGVGLLFHATQIIAVRIDELPVEAGLGEYGRLVAMSVSALADAASFTFAVILVTDLWRMGGGLLARPYLLLAANNALFLALDLALLSLGANTYGGLGSILPHLPAVGWGFVSAAAVAHLQLVRRSSA